MGTKCLCGFRASGDKRTQHLAIPNQALDVRRLDHLQKFVGRIAGEAADSSGCVKKTDTHAEAVVYNQVELETSGAFIHKIILVLIKDKSLNPPVVVDKVRIEKIHTPSCFWRWETAEKKHAGVRMHKRLQWMSLNGLFCFRCLHLQKNS